LPAAVAQQLAQQQPTRPTQTNPFTDSFKTEAK
jgi:hypothetical protein